MLETKNYILNLSEEFIKKFKDVFSIKKKFGRECSWGQHLGKGREGRRTGQEQKLGCSEVSAEQMQYGKLCSWDNPFKLS